MMKRGVMEWERAELPAEELQERLTRARSLMARKGLSALLVFGDTMEAGDLCFFTNFSPYWFSAALLLTTKTDVLLTTLSNRVHNWIRELTPATEIKASKAFGKDVVAILQEAGLAKGAVGVARLDILPYTIYKDLSAGVGEVVDATALVNGLRTVPGKSETGLMRLAAFNCAKVLEDLPVDGKKECEVVAEVERRVRYRQAEDVQILIASSSSQTWSHVATQETIKDGAMIQVFSAYKGCWAAAGRTVAAGGASKDGEALAQACSDAMSSVVAGTTVAGISSAVGQRIAEKLGKTETVLCTVMAHQGVPAFQEPLSSEVKLADGNVVVVRVGVVMPSGRRSFYSDTFRIGEESSTRLSS